MSRIKNKLSQIISSQVPEFIRANDTTPIVLNASSTSGSNVLQVNSTLYLTPGDQIIEPTLVGSPLYIAKVLTGTKLILTGNMPYSWTNRTISIGKQNTDSNFVKFLKAYYQFLEQDQYPQELLQNARDYADTEKTIDSLLESFFKNYANDIPRNLATDKRTFLKHVRDIYKTKGTEQAYKLLFQALFGEKVELFYPDSVILKASDGVWKKDYTIRVYADSSTNGFEFLNTRITGEVSKATATVNNVIKLQVREINVYELYLENIKGNFTYEKVTAKKLITAPSKFMTVSANTMPILVNVDIVNSKSGYTANSKITLPIANITGGIFATYDQTLSVFVDSISDTGKIQSINVVNPGIYYGSNIKNIPNIEIPVYIESPSANVLGATITILNSTGTYTSSYPHGLSTGNKANLIFYGNSASYLNSTENTIAVLSVLDTKRFKFAIPNPPASNTLYNTNLNNTRLYANLKYTEKSVLSANIGVVKESKGYWLTSKGKISDVIHLHGPAENSTTPGLIYYQPYSYVVRSDVNIGEWKNIVENLVHPAGTEVFSEIYVNNELSANSNALIKGEVWDYLGITADKTGIFNASMTTYSDHRVSNLAIKADHVVILFGYL
jgi:hypothetical protein